MLRLYVLDAFTSMNISTNLFVAELEWISSRP